MRIAIATDAWHPQVNGVVTTLASTRAELAILGHEVLMITPQDRFSLPCPTYPEIRLALLQSRRIAQELKRFEPECVHVATEGPIGHAVRRYCIRNRLPFTTSYHTRFPEYVRARAPVPANWTFAFLRWFHGAAARTLVPTESIHDMLLEKGFKNVGIWSRGVDTDLFHAGDKADLQWPRPVWINVGRVSVEKNLEQFLKLDLAGTKVIVGDGPDRERLAREYPECHFPGYLFGAQLACYLAAADVFVFPSRTDTFGLVMLEAMACGLPVAALPVTGPVDVVENGVTGMLDDDLKQACLQALTVDRAACRRYAEQRSWRTTTGQFLAQLAKRLDDTGGDASGARAAHP